MAGQPGCAVIHHPFTKFYKMLNSVERRVFFLPQRVLKWC